MVKELKVSVPNEILVQAAMAFYPVYGHALAEWARLENSLYWWFVRITGMNDKMARAIFFSAKSFNSRADMLDAAVRAPHTLSPEQTAFIKAVINKARGYSSFRNRVTHGEPMLHLNIYRSEASVQLVEGKNTSEGPKILTDELRIATDNFYALRQLAVNIIPGLETEKSYQQLLEQVLLLPHDANSKNIPTPSKPSQRPQQPVHRNKKAHRAQQKAAREEKS